MASISMLDTRIEGEVVTNITLQESVVPILLLPRNITKTIYSEIKGKLKSQ